jgi:hypothetical protein
VTYRNLGLQVLLTKSFFKAPETIVETVSKLTTIVKLKITHTNNRKSMLDMLRANKMQQSDSQMHFVTQYTNTSIIKGYEASDQSRNEFDFFVKDKGIIGLKIIPTADSPTNSIIQVMRVPNQL